MPITVKFFASLRESLDTSECVIDWDSLTADNKAPTAELVWQNIDEYLNASGKKAKAEINSSNIFCAINHEHAQLHDTLSDEDELAFFPAITGG